MMKTDVFKVDWMKAYSPVYLQPAGLGQDITIYHRRKALAWLPEESCHLRPVMDN